MRGGWWRTVSSTCTRRRSACSRCRRRVRSPPAVMRRRGRGSAAPGRWTWRWWRCSRWRGVSGRTRDRRAGVVSRNRGSEDPRRQAGSVRGGAGRLPAAHVSRPRCRRGADHARPGLRGGAGATHGAVLYRHLAHLGHHHRARDGGLRARRAGGDGRAAGVEGSGRGDGRGPARRRRGPGRDAAVRQLAAPAAARSRDVHAGDGPARARTARRRSARWEGGGCGCGGFDVLRHRRRPRARRGGGARRRGDRAAGALGAGRRAGMVTAEQLAARREEIAGAPDLAALRAHLAARAAPVIARMPAVPDGKALLSSDGGVCPDDGTALAFDPWSPTAHRCPRCGKTFTGERHDRHWARYQHLWLAERAAHLAALAALDADAGAAGRAVDILRAYSRSYWGYPNRDNVLGPSRLFFSTYLESMWIGNYLAAAALLRACGKLESVAAQAVSGVAEEAANLIGEFDEGFSNRQTWNNAALTAIAVWFEDEDLAKRAIEGPTGLLEHLLRGFGRDGMWYEGENYHLFALRGLLIGAMWARQAGVDIFAEPPLAARLRAALLAPAYTALPDFTFPARKDSRFGVSLGQPAYLELWEIGIANLGEPGAGSGTPELVSWLATLYRGATVKPELFESYLHDAPMEQLSAPRPPSRSTLSWWALLLMAPELPADPGPWSPSSRLLEAPGLALLRAGGRYVGLECGQYGGGHGHHDRLHLTMHADGVHWLADPGTGSYVSRDLFWYRSTLAHNAPLTDGVSQPRGDATCEAFDAPGEWAWARGRYGEVTRTLVSGPAYV